MTTFIVVFILIVCFWGAFFLGVRVGEKKKKENW